MLITFARMLITFALVKKYVNNLCSREEGGLDEQLKKIVVLYLSFPLGMVVLPIEYIYIYIC